MSREWTFGDVLETRAGEKLIFIRWDPERTKLTGGGYQWLIGMRLTGGGSGYLKRKGGVIGNYQETQCRTVRTPIDMADLWAAQNAKLRPR